MGAFQRGCEGAELETGDAVLENRGSFGRSSTHGGTHVFTKFLYGCTLSDSCAHLSASLAGNVKGRDRCRLGT